MKISKLKEIIKRLEKFHGNIDDVSLNFREDYDSDPILLSDLSEDLYKDDNLTLDSLTFLPKY